MSNTELECEVLRLRALLAEVYTALLAAGWRDDTLVKRVKEATKP